MIRFLLALITIIIVFALSVIALPLEWLLGKISMNARNKSSMKIIQGVFRIICFIAGVKIQVSGAEKIPTSQAVLYIGNHRGIFDILVTYPFLPGITGYVAKKKLKKIPILYHWMCLIKCLFLDREDPRQGLKTILQGIDYIKSGVSIFIFPEGTRGKTDRQMLPFKDGSFKLATKSLCPIVPVAIQNTSKVFEDQFPKMRKTNVSVCFCDPIYTDALSKEEIKKLPEITQDIIQKAISKSQ